MGIGNTATASVLMSIITAIPLDKCVGMGTGISNEKLMRQKILKSSLIKHSVWRREDDAGVW
jgi:nicotinate-nucleotide--dimethylbenzimidazole phosphoribosyltransferase